MRKFTLTDATAIAIWLLPFLYLFINYNNLPTELPVHYGWDGKANRFGSKNEFLVVILAVQFSVAAVYMVIKFLHIIDPKRADRAGEQTFNKLAFIIVVFLSAISIAITYNALNKDIRIDKLLLPLISLLFVFLGNLMHTIKPSYLVGVRTPWTLQSEDTWRATHQVTGKLWVGGGILTAILVFLLPTTAATVAFTTCIIIMSAIPVGYSYIHYKRNEKVA